MDSETTTITTLLLLLLLFVNFFFLKLPSKKTSRVRLILTTKLINQKMRLILKRPKNTSEGVPMILDFEINQKENRYIKKLSMLIGLILSQF